MAKINWAELELLPYDSNGWIVIDGNGNSFNLNRINYCEKTHSVSITGTADDGSVVCIAAEDIPTKVVSFGNPAYEIRCALGKCSADNAILNIKMVNPARAYEQLILSPELETIKYPKFTKDGLTTVELLEHARHNIRAQLVSVSSKRVTIMFEETMGFIVRKDKGTLTLGPVVIDLKCVHPIKIKLVANDRLACDLSSLEGRLRIVLKRIGASDIEINQHNVTLRLQSRPTVTVKADCHLSIGEMRFNMYKMKSITVRRPLASNDSSW